MIHAIKRTLRRAGRLLVGLSVLGAGPAWGGDWPMWRFDAARSANTPEALPAQLHLQWVRKYPPLRPAYWQERQERVQFDRGYEPIVLGKTLFVGSGGNDRLVALDTDTGAEKWRFNAEGPIRLAPAGWEGKVYVGSDDGRLYCLSAEEGRVLWSIQAAPSNRKVLGNGRLMSLWPVRGGPVVVEGVVYFAAGVWPFEGVFVCAADARSGKLLWVNDRTGSMYQDHPHAAPSFGGPSPQGYLLVQGDELIVPGGRSFPAFFDRRTGALTHFDFGHAGHGSMPGSWFVAVNAQGQLAVDPDLNNETHDEGLQIIGQRAAKRKAGEPIAKQVKVGQREYQIQAGVSQSIRAGGREYRFSDDLPGIRGPVHSLLAADGKLFAVLRSGEICCFAGKASAPVHHELQPRPLSPSPGAAKAKEILQITGQTKGYALLWGLGDGALLEDLLLESELHIVAIDPDAQKVAAARQRLDQAGVYGQRVAVHAGHPLEFGLPPYLASLIVVPDAKALGLGTNPAFVDQLFRTLRPYGGVACLPASAQESLAAKSQALAGSQVRRAGDYSLLVRQGPLPGASDYSGRPNFDANVGSPLGVLWFGDTFHHHKLYWKGYLTPETGRGLPTTIRVENGLIAYAAAQAAIGANPPGMPYREYLQFMDRNVKFIDAYTDIYTGRVLADAEAKATAKGASAAQGASGITPMARKNPLTGAVEAREFAKSHGCDLSAVDYGNLLTLRSGTAAYYDPKIESGLVNISGVRSGCRNTVVPGDGVLCLPSWTGNCSCNYPIYTSLALVQMPEEYEEWAAWGPVAVTAPLQRVGINFGAPGDRMTRGGTLWLDYPSVGGPSPNVPVKMTPEKPQVFYRHALRMQGGEGWPWVNASGVAGINSVRIQPVAKRPPVGNNFSVRWSGLVQAEQSQTYTFFVRVDSGARLWVGDQLLLDSSKKPASGPDRELSGSIALEAGKKVPLRLEYFRAKDARPQQSFAELRWSSPGTAKAIVPANCLFSAEGRPGGLTGIYYGQPNLSGPALLQTDSQVGFEWGSQPPAALRKADGVANLDLRRYTVRLYFAEPENLAPGQRIFSVKLQGQEVLKNLDIVKEAGQSHRGIVREFKKVLVNEALQVDFAPSTERPALICGIEMIAE